MVSITNPPNPSLTDTAQTAARARLADPKAGSSQDAASTSDPSNDRGPAVTIDVAALRDLKTRLDALNAMPDDTANALADQLQKSTDALNTLDQARKSTAADRKKEAEQKLEQARKKLQLLQILGGDPKTMASQAKDIGKELKDAASQYTTAMKDAAGGKPAAGATTPTDPAATATADGATASSIDDAGTSADTNSNAETDTAKLASGTNETQPAAADAPDGAAAQPVFAPPMSAAEKASASAATYKLFQHDRDVLSLFTQAANQVKEILKEAAQKVSAQNAADPDAHATNKTTDEMDKAIAELGDTVRIAQSGGDISAPDGRSGTAGPLLDIRA